MLDRQLRPVKDVVLDPLVRILAGFLRPNTITVIGFATGILAAAAAWLGRFPLALGLFVANRIIDGLDGAVARAGGTTSDAGGYLDIVLDFGVYAAIPLAIAAGNGSPEAWRSAALLTATYYINAASWMYLSALLEDDTPTSLPMAAGIVEGTETIIFYVLFLLLPHHFALFAVMMAATTLIGAAVRTAWGFRYLRRRRA